MEAPAISYALKSHPKGGSGLQFFKALKHDLFYRWIACRRTLPLVSLGNPAQGHQWTFCPGNLNEDAVVVSAGVGRDISFELGLIQEFGCKILLLDPSPTGIATMAQAPNQHPKLHFLKMALAGQDRRIIFHEPLNAEEGSFSAFVGTRKGPEVEGISLATLTKRHRLNKIDLLKLDIEGAEYELIDSILKSNIQVTQICVEYHNQILPGIPTAWTAGSLLRLWLRGWQIIHKDGGNHTLWNQRMFKQGAVHR